MDFNENKPIYLQIADGISEKILSGELNEGGRGFQSSAPTR